MGMDRLKAYRNLAQGNALGKRIHKIYRALKGHRIVGRTTAPSGVNMISAVAPSPFQGEVAKTSFAPQGVALG